MDTDEDRHRRRVQHGLVVEEEEPIPPEVEPIVNIEVPTEVKALVVSVGVSHATPGQDHSRRANYNSTPCTEQV